MGYVLPGWLDEILDFIGINWPNVDEDDYREMADAMRELADAFDEHAGEAHGAVNRLLSSSEGWAVEALQEHWGKVKSSHLEQLPEVARLFADAMDVVADVIYGMKVKAEVELGVMAASVGVSIGLAFVTGGLSALIGAAEIAAMREVVRRIIKEAADQIVDQVMAMVTEPVAAKLEKMVTDAVLDLAAGAISPADGSGGGGGKGAAAMQLNSADGSAGGGPAGPAGGGAGRMRIDHGEYDKAAGHLGRLSESSLTRLSGSLDRASGANSRTRGKDPFTQGIDSVVDGATKGMKKAVERIIKHTGETIPKNLRDTSENHKRNEKSNEDALKKIMGGQDGKGPGGPSKGPAGGRGGAGAGTSLLNKALNDPRHHGVPLGARTCRNDPVDVATGQMVLPQTDLSLPGVLPLVFRRTHLSDYSFGVWFGPSWASTLDERIEVDIRNKAIWARDDGSLLVYDQLPTPAQPEVLPVEGPRIPLRRTSAFGSDVLEFSVTDARSGLTRYFAKTHPQGWRLWLVAIEDRNGNQVDIHRDTAGMPLSVTHNGGYDVQLAGDPDLGRIQTLSLRTPDGPESVAQVMSYGYDSAGNLVAVTNSSGVPLRFEYDGAGRLISWTDRNASTFHYVYDAVGRVTQTIGPEGFLSSTFTYDTANRITRYTDSTGATTVYQLNDHLQVTAETNPLGHTTRFAYDSRDRLLEHTDALGHTTRFERDDRGNLVSLTAADGARATAAFNELDLPVTITERGGLQRRYEYDTKGNPTAVVEADGARTHYTIDDRGHVTAIRDATGATTRIRNNAAGLPIEITAPSGARTTLTRDAFGRITAATDPLGHTVRQGWTVEGKPLWRELADGTREEWAWDGEGNLTSHTDRNGHTRTHTVTHFDRPASTHTTDGGDYRFTHDTELRLTTVTNAQGHQWHYHYDAAGRLTSETDFDGRTLTYEHDALGRLTRRTNAAGQTLTYERDTRGRVVRLQHDDGTASSITYDSTGHAVQITNAHARIELERDPTGRIVAETVNGHTLRRAYDVLGRPTHRRTPSGATSALTYDEQGLASYTAGEHTFRFERDPLGRETVRHLDGTLALHQHWDAVGRLTHQTLTGPHDTLLARAFTYHPDGTPRAIEDSLTGPRTYTTDPAGRITAVTARGWSERYAYNTAGDQTHSTLPNQAPGQDTSGERHYSGARITQAGRTRYTYDAQGRVTERRTTTLSGKTLTWTFAWDAEDRLTDVHAPRGTHWRYLYDALGRRIAKMRLTAEGRCEESTSYCWDGAQLAEQHSNGITLVWDYTGLRPLAQREAKTDPAQQEIDRRFFAIVTDLAGSPSDLIAPDGTVAWRGRSTAWGATQFQRAATAYTPLRYPGQYFDPETGLHYNVNRYYDPDLGRYITSDPLGLAPAVNPYAYVPNPFTFADPLGLAGCESDPTWGGRVVFTRDEHGRPFEMHATVSRDMLDEGTDARKSLRPPGFVHGTDHNQGRGHMLANRLGGSGDTLDNLFTITQNPTNSPHMRDLEASIYDAVKGPNGNDGEIVQYSVYLEYTDDRKDSVPKWITMEADGNRGFSLRADFENPDHAAQQVRRSRGIH
ncbi:RHS repeat-associated core domain-containing protein [Streptomyces viridochromogenes]|uniref:Putative RHS/YD repeat-containing protein n=1 Tax=Streptomyces viridochromogenes Tue57 TaxID=1160705 RepID=L8PR92_STRVR|nr:RHS repeat-associated core domain-containing protein [Streptomyces viridochromogenes]ELS58533.1 putative RHS/YD repeat-containing protein [Streptomyces viridochromogenes Tue57]